MLAPKTGLLLKNGMYEIRNALGKGRFGEVFLAIWHHPEGPRRVAIKWFSPDVLSSQELGSNSGLHQETNLLSALQHDAVVKILGLESEGEIAYLVEEYLAGGSLHDFIVNSKPEDFENGTISPLKFVNIALSLARGLDVVHSKGFFHGDIKPSNICFRDLLHTDAVLVDFGHGGNSDAELLGRSGINVAATLSYLPPERTGFVKEIGNASSDLYSLGISLYELITRKTLFEGEAPKEIIAKILCQIPVSVSELYPDFPEQMSEIIQKLARKNPVERYQTAVGLIADLEHCRGFLIQDKKITPFALGRRDKIRELNYKIPMVGRRNELEHLAILMQQTLQGNGKTVFVGAPSGSGKSRLAGEFSSRARAHGMRILSAKFSEFERNVPFSAIGVALQEYAGWMRTQSQATQNAWRENLFEALGDKGQLLSKRLNFLADIFPAFPPLLKMQKEEEYAAFYEVLAKFLSRLNANATGYVIFLDDLQWADSESLEVVRRLQDLANSEDLGHTLFLATYRSDEVAAEHPFHFKILSTLTESEKIFLGPLMPSESNELVGYLLDESGEEVDKLKQTTFRLTQGNPFYIYEYLKSAISSGVFALNSSGTKWAFNASLAASVAMTRGAAGLVAERIKKLPKPALEVILAASALGNTVDLLSLKTVLHKHIKRKMADNADSELKEQLSHWMQDGNFLVDDFCDFACDKLRRDHLITPSESHFCFFHDKIRESSYELIDVDEKKNIHHDFGEFLAPIYLSQENTAKKVSSKDIYELAFHIIQGFGEVATQSERNLLFLAAQRAVEVFSYAKAREYLETASRMFGSETLAEDLGQWIEIHELLAECLALSEQIEQALNLYDKVLEHVSEPLSRAEIYAKIGEYNFSLFRYSDSVNAAIKGLRITKIKFINSEPEALLYMFIWIPKLIGQIILAYIFGFKQKIVDSREKEIQFRLYTTAQLACYFSVPFCAIANHMNFTGQLLHYKENYYRAMVFSYWGVLTSALGMEKTTRYLFARVSDYFDKYPNPVAKGFLTFIWGYLLEFPLGQLKESRIKLNSAFEMLAGVGESFWRSLCLQGLSHIDVFGLGSADSSEVNSQLIAIWKRVKFEPTVLGCVMKNLLLEGRHSEVDEWMKVTLDAAACIKKQGFKTLDYCYANLAPGEICLLRDENERALPLLQEAFWNNLIHFHRVAYSTFSPILLASAYIRLHKPFRAIFPLFVSWLNLFLNVKVFKPFTLFTTGEFFAEIGLLKLGQLCFEWGIAIARKNDWFPTLAEGRLRLGKLCAQSNPEYAEGLVERARQYYQERGHVFLEDKCERLFKSTRNKNGNFVSSLTSTSMTEGFSAHGTLLRQNLETSALLEIFLRLSSLTEKDPLLQAVLESLCSCTGSDVAIVFLKHGDTWIPDKSMGVPLDSLIQGLYGKAAVDKYFIDSFIQSHQKVPCIRKASEHVFSGSVAGSVMVLPLCHNDQISGYCYLGNSKIDDLFDEHSVETVTPISTQAAIALQNIYLLAETEEKAVLDAELKATKAVQEALLPVAGTQLPGMSIAYWYQAASTAGGDWLAYYYNPISHRVYLCVGDVTGHGFPSALITGVVCGAVFSSEFTAETLDFEANLSAAEHLKLIAQATNQAVVRTGNRTGRLMTMCFLSLDVITGEVAYINAGHLPPLVIQKTPTNVEGLMNPSNHLGYSADSEFTVKNFRLNPGDSICIYTDGLIENTGPSATVLKSKQLKKVLENHFEVEDACNAIVQAGMKIWQDTPFADDISILVARWNGPIDLSLNNKTEILEQVVDAKVA